MAEGLLRHRCNGTYEICSAGVAPIHVNPFAISVMRERGIDISGHTPASVYQYQNQTFDYVITLCDHARAMAGEHLPDGLMMFHRAFETPSEIGRSHDEITDDFRHLMDSIDQWLSEIFPDLPCNSSGSRAGDLSSERERGEVPGIPLESLKDQRAGKT